MELKLRHLGVWNVKTLNALLCGAAQMDGEYQMTSLAKSEEVSHSVRKEKKSYIE
jgi:hypothetical protein